MNVKNVVFIFLLLSCFLVSCVPLCMLTTTTTTIKTPPVTLPSTPITSVEQQLPEVISTVNDLSEHLADLSDDVLYDIVIADLQPSLENIKNSLRTFPTKKLIINLQKSTNLTTIVDSAFYENANMQSILFPNTITKIETKAFSYCSKLEEVIIPNGVTTIDGYAFSNCTNLKKVILPNFLTKISPYLLQKCSKLESVTLPDEITTIDTGAFSSSGLKKIYLGSKITSVAGTAFYGCSSLKNVYFSGSIDNWCSIDFASNDANPLYMEANLIIGDLTQDNLVIPESVSEIKNYCFYGCKCNTITVNRTEPPKLGQNVFKNCNQLTTIYVPTTAVDLYKSTTGWSQFADKIKSIEE